MRTLKRSVLLLSLCVTAPALLAQGPPASRVDPVKSERLALTVDSIMRGPDLVGYAPDALRWADEYKRILKLFEENLRTGKAPRPTH